MNSIIDVIQRCGVDLTRRGNLYVGLCPLHNDKDTPSLTVYPATNSWCCFGACGNKSGRNGGDAIEFVMQRFNYTYPQAKEWLGDCEPVEVLPFNVKQKKHTVVPPKIIDYWHALLNFKGKRVWFHSRGFCDDIIDSERWGWDGTRFCIPVWDGKPGESVCLGVRKRIEAEGTGQSKYIGMRGRNQPALWGKWHCLGAPLIFAFAGELDAAMAVQDGLAAFSVVNGVESIGMFPDEWPEIWFPQAERLVVVFDKKEEVFGGRLAGRWNKVKGAMKARIFQWPPQFEVKDYCDFRERYTFDDFMNLGTFH